MLLLTEEDNMKKSASGLSAKQQASWVDIKSVGVCILVRVAKRKIYYSDILGLRVTLSEPGLFISFLCAGLSFE